MSKLRINNRNETIPFSLYFMVQVLKHKIIENYNLQPSIKFSNRRDLQSSSLLDVVAVYRMKRKNDSLLRHMVGNTLCSL
jgi:hypothetical protein